jgi:hypothetical protein
VKSFDGVPLDVDVTLPPTGDGPSPTIVMLHGYGRSKTDFEQTKADGNGQPSDAPSSAHLYHWNNVHFAKRGYAVVNYSARGLGALVREARLTLRSRLRRAGCTFGSRVRFRNARRLRGARRLKVTVRYRGNVVLTAAGLRARRVHVRG